MDFSKRRRKRDASSLEVGDILVADGHKLAFQVINPFTGKPCRATLVGFLDWKSTALVGYEIMLEENTQCIFQEGFEKLLPSYIGSNIQNKPVYMMRNEKLHKSWHNEYIPTIAETIKMIDMWLSFKNSQQCPNAPDKTIAEVLAERKRQNIDIKTLDDLMLATEVKTIQRNGIRFLNCDYFDKRLYGFKSKVLIKYNLFDLTSLKVFTTKGEYLCTAERITETHPMAKMLGDVKDFEDYKQKIVKQRQLRRKTINSVKQYLSNEEVKFVEQKMNEPKKIEFKPRSNAVQTLFKNNSEKYEYLITHNPNDEVKLKIFRRWD